MSSPPLQTLATSETTRGSDDDTASGESGAVPGLFVLFSPARGVQGATLRLGDAPICIGRASQCDGGRGLSDPRMSQRHAELQLIARDRARVTDLDSRNGTRINGVRINAPSLLTTADVLQLGSTFFQLVPDVLAYGGPEQRDAVAEELVGQSVAIRRLRTRIRQLAPLETSVMILGPSGSGKEQTAKALHLASGRQGALVSLNCAVLTDEFAASELFGHVRGAFTGALDARLGAFRQAQRGTLFLDEIGDMPLSLQAKLLRALQERHVRPLGSDRDVEVDVRLITATNQDLPGLVRRGQFRGDLFSRIAAAVLTIPPLRERPADVVILAQHFLADRGAQLHPRAIQELLQHDWPYNVRDLRTLVALLGPAEDGHVRLNTAAREKLQLDARLTDSADESPLVVWPDGDDARKQLLEQLLAEHKGNVSHVARVLGKAGRSVRRWVKRYNINLERFR